MTKLVVVAEGDACRIQRTGKPLARAGSDLVTGPPRAIRQLAEHRAEIQRLIGERPDRHRVTAIG